MLLLQALSGRCVKLWKTNVIVPDAAESVLLQEGSPELAVLYGKHTQSFVLAAITFQATMAQAPFGSKPLFCFGERSRPKHLCRYHWTRGETLLVLLFKKNKTKEKYSPTEAALLAEVPNVTDLVVNEDCI